MYKCGRVTNLHTLPGTIGFRGYRTSGLKLVQFQKTRNGHLLDEGERIMPAGPDNNITSVGQRVLGF